MQPNVIPIAQLLIWGEAVTFASINNYISHWKTEKCLSHVLPSEWVATSWTLYAQLPVSQCAYEQLLVPSDANCAHALHWPHLQCTLCPRSETPFWQQLLPFLLGLVLQTQTLHQHCHSQAHCITQNTATSVLTLWYTGSCSRQPHHHYNYLAHCIIQHTATSSLPLTGTVHHTECFQINILTLYNTASYNTGTWPVPYSATLHHTVHSHIGIITVEHCIIRPTATSAFSLSSIPHHTAYRHHSITTLCHNALYNTWLYQHYHPLAQCIIQYSYTSMITLLYTAS